MYVTLYQLTPYHRGEIHEVPYFRRYRKLAVDVTSQSLNFGFTVFHGGILSRRVELEAERSAQSHPQRIRVQVRQCGDNVSAPLVLLHLPVCEAGRWN